MQVKKSPNSAMTSPVVKLILPEFMTCKIKLAIACPGISAELKVRWIRV